MRYQALLKEHHDELGEILAHDTGKTFEDAKGDVWRGIEVVEQAANIPSNMMGETVENVANGIDTYTYIQPLGVCVGITPFNFPAMIPAVDVPAGHRCRQYLCAQALRAGAPDAGAAGGTVHRGGSAQGRAQYGSRRRRPGQPAARTPGRQAASFVGSSPVGEHIYRTGTAAGKRVQCMMGAKNHMVIMPDADPGAVLNALVGSSVGAGRPALHGHFGRNVRG